MDDDNKVDELVVKAVGGDREATVQLLVEQSSRLERRLNAKMQSNRYPDISADDVLQEVFVDVFKGIGSFDPDRGVPIQAWLNKVADNRLARVFRDRGRKKRGGDAWKVDGPNSSVMRLIHDFDDSQAITGSRNFAKEEAKQAVEVCVAALPDNQREAIEKYYLKNGNLAAVAEELGITKEALRGLLYRARKTMREMMGTSSLWFSKRG